MTRLGDVSGDRNNNLNLIRMVAASAVLVSHAFPITLGPGAQEPLSAWVGVSLGTTAVFIFFAISGFLISASFENARSLADWGAARALRLFPGLFVVLILTVAVLGPGVTALPLGSYVAEPATLTYVPRNLSLALLQYDLPGVFAENPYPGAINGSLWTLFHEVVCYIGVLVAGVLGAFRARPRMAIAILAYVAAYIFVKVSGVDLPHHAQKLTTLSLPFFIGFVFYAVRSRLPLNGFAALGLWALAYVALGSPVSVEVFALALSYTTFWLGYAPKGAVRRYNELGDYSYGTYIYAFPMQQLSVYLFPGQSPYANMATAGVATLLLAVLSWRFVEKPALARRKAAAAWVNARIATRARA